MKKVLLIILFSLIAGQNHSADLFNQTVSEEYCYNVIGNMTALIKEGYVYLDFLKAPKQPQGKEGYIPKVDLIEELENINKTNRTFFDFYADIQNVLSKTRDGHFGITVNEMSDLYFHFYCLPFYVYVKEVLDENNRTNDTYLTIEENTEFCSEGYSEETLNKTKELNGKKILQINGMEPYSYLEEMSKKGNVVHSPQCRYILTYNYLSNLYLDSYPLKIEDLTTTIKFEGEEQEFTIDYQLKRLEFFSEEFKQYYIKERRKYFKLNMPIPRFEEIELKFKIEKGLIDKDLLKDEEDIWELKSSDGTIKCRVDEVNQFNVLLQRSFAPNDFDNYEDIMYQCFSKFYSNDYKIIIIEFRNGGGYSELCVPFTQYVHPKILKPVISAMRVSDLIYKTFFKNDENLNPETCFPFTEKDNILDGKEDLYTVGNVNVTHKRTKDTEGFNIYEKKIMENKRREYLSSGKTKKPTEILVFTDGFSFSCTSVFIRGLQVNGHGITVGYNARPDLDKTDFDASQSNSAVETFDFSEYTQNLESLGFSSRITFTEEFDPNDKGEPQTPMEFQIYPVDEISDIYVGYDDERYDRFINVAKTIFEKYNDLENGECNPDNKYLYYETSECDSVLEIDKAHGGYLCGENGKWNTSNCIAAYCDSGYILNNDRNECIKDPCENIALKEISLNESKEYIFTIEPNNSYIFTIEAENYTYNFYSEIESLFYFLNENHILELSPNGTEFSYPEKIYVNYFVNLTENTTISIIYKNESEEEESSEEESSKEEESPHEEESPKEEENPHEEESPKEEENPKEEESPHEEESPKEEESPHEEESHKEEENPHEEESHKEEESPHEEESHKEEESPHEEENPPDNKDDDSDGLSAGILALIIIGSIIGVVLITVVIIIFISRKKKLSNEDIEGKTEKLNPMESL